MTPLPLRAKASVKRESQAADGEELSAGPRQVERRVFRRADWGEAGGARWVRRMVVRVRYVLWIGVS